jgi:CheY-like chemotaxis protein
LQEKAAGRKLLLIAVTGYGQEEDRRRSLEAGIHLHLLKPVEPEELKELLARFKTIIGA